MILTVTMSLRLSIRFVFLSLFLFLFHSSSPSLSFNFLLLFVDVVFHCLAHTCTSTEFFQIYGREAAIPGLQIPSSSVKLLVEKYIQDLLPYRQNQDVEHSRC